MLKLYEACKGGSREWNSGVDAKARIVDRR
jgi:hypothetical protein